MGVEQRPIDYDTPRYTLRETARAADYSLNTLRALFVRGKYRIIGGDRTPGRGSSNRLSLRDVLSVAVAGAITRAGVLPEDAFSAGAHFAHGSDQDGGHLRLPGQLFSTGFTVLLYRPATKRADVINMTTEAPSISFTDLFFDAVSAVRGPVVAILLNDIERKVFLELNV